jgi:outer membrane receptor protein involved in Fe transport
MSQRIFVSALACCCLMGQARAGVFGTVRGVVHDPSHRPVLNAEVSLRAVASDYARQVKSDAAGEFEFPTIPAGRYTVSVSLDGFEPASQQILVESGTAPVLHLRLGLASQKEAVSVTAQAEPVNAESAGAATIVDRREIQQTPGAALSNSMAMITSFVPGAYLSHDQLHIRGGHQVTWAIDGVPIPNTNIASNVGPQIDPKDIDYLEVMRGGYSAEYGDRAYAVMDIVPRTGFERDNEADLLLTGGSFGQTNDQISFGGHTAKFAYFGSMNGNRSDWGLEAPGPDILHDHAWGTGGFSSLIWNVTPSDQLRLITSLRRDDYQIPNDPEQQAAGIDDVERERDAAVTFTWAHTISPALIATVSPFLHYNRATYDGGANDVPVSTTQDLGSLWAGGQATLAAVTRGHNARAGLYAWAQADDENVHLTANDGSGLFVAQRLNTAGHMEAAFLEDQWKAFSWLTLTGGLRATHFAGSISEGAVDPRAGVAVRIPRLGWVLRGFWGRYYQAPPLSTVSGPLLEFALTQGLALLPLNGERDQEAQFGIAIPLHGWTVEADRFQIRARNYFDHNAIGNSNLFFPVTIQSARIYGEEVTVRSPRLFHRGQLHVAYSHQHAEASGAISGGLTDFEPPEQGWFLLDHDQRHTLSAGFDVALDKRTQLAATVYHGSGFPDDDTGTHLPRHTTVDMVLGRSFGENWNVSLTALNVANRRFLLDNSETFGGMHYADPRQIYVELRYRFHY